MVHLQYISVDFFVLVFLLQVEVAVDPEKISTTHLQLGLPLIFILSQEETLEADKRIAESVAWQLLGKAGVLLLSRSFGIKKWGGRREGRTYLTIVLISV